MTTLISILFGAAVLSAPQQVSASTTPIATTTIFEQTFGAQAPLFFEIARCESTMRQWGSDGKVLRGIVNRADVGILQINEDAHAKEAEKLGLDIYTLEGNLAFAKWLYERDHLRPWAPSVACWGHMLD